MPREHVPINAKLSAMTIRTLITNMLESGVFRKDDWKTIVELSHHEYKNTKGITPAERDHDYHVQHWKKKKVDKE